MSTSTDLQGAELFFGLVGAVGTDLEIVSSALKDALEEVNYTVQTIRLSDLLHEIDKWKDLSDGLPEYDRIMKHMDAGNQFRETLESGDALALPGIAAIRKERKLNSASKNQDEPIPFRAYVFRSLKHQEEALTLRKIYGAGFSLIAAYSPRETRLQNLAKRIAESDHVFHAGPYRSKAEFLIQRDEAEVGKKFGQNVRETFPMSDVFINASYPDELQKSIVRFVELLFGNTFHTPTCDEYGMFHAQAAALRSSSLGRQVGAAITTNRGDIVAVGTNEVPRAGGGLYWCDDEPDHRDFIKGQDFSDKMKRDLLADILQRLKSGGWLTEEKNQKDIENLVNEALAENDSALMEGAQFLNIIEFGRSVHAEMAALVDASRRGVSVEGCNLYVTTFPCHDCAKHIVAAGIQKVVYIEPYPKSLVPEFYVDSIIVDGTGKDQISFVPFVGIAPRKYMDLFAMTERKYRGGKVAIWKKSTAKPRLVGSPPSYLRNEKDNIDIFYEKMRQKGLTPIIKKEGE